MADRTVAGAGGSTSLRGLRERMVAAAQAIAEERRNQSGANSFAAHSPNLKSTCKPVIDGSVLKNDLKQKLAKERREERKRQQEANKETQLLEKERKSKLQFEKQLEEKQRKLREQKEKDERRRISAEEKRKQKLEEERERYKAVLSRTLERSNRFDQRQKRWSWEGSVMVNSENKSGKTENKRSSSLNRRENKIHSSTDIKPMEDKPARRFHNPQENNLINRLLVPTRASVARSKSAASLSIQGKDIPGITHLFHYVNVPLRSRSSDELKTSMMFCKAAIKVPLQTKLEIAPLEKVETPLKMNVEAFPNTSTEVPPKTSTDVPPMANTEVLPKAHTEVPPKARTDVLSMASIEVPPKPGPEVQPKASIEVPCDMSADPPPMLSMDVSPVVSAKTSPVVSVETSPLVSVETSPVVSMDDSPEVSLDTSPEVSMDTSPEANMEVFLEESMEATPEVNVEVTPEFNVEATTEFDVEANTEFDVEAALEFDVEATPEVSVEATPEVSVEATPEVNVEATPEVSVEATSEVGVEVTPEVNVEATPSENVETTPKENVEVPPEASVEAPNKESVEAPPEGNVAASPKESMKAPPEVIVEVPPKATPKKPEMDKKISNPVPKKRLSSSIPSYRWPSPPARGYHPPSSRNTIRHSQKTHHLSSSPALSKQSAQPSMNYKIIPVQRTLFVPNALGTANKKRETVYTAPNKCEPVSQKHMTLQESGNRSTPGTMSAEEATRILAEKRRLARAQKDKEGGTLQSEMTPSLNRKVPVTVEKVDEVQVKEVSRCEDEQQEKEIEKNKGCQHHEDQEVLLQKGDAKIKAQEEADKRKKERERIMLQNLQERLERKKRIEEIMKRTRKTSVNASKVTETSSNNISEEGEADDEDETESDEDSLDEMFPSAIGNGKHKMPYKNAMRKPQKLVFLQDTTGQILKDKKVYFNGDVKIFKQKGPKDTLTQAKGSRLFTKRTSTRTTKTGKAKETNATVQSTLSVNTNQIIDINSHNTESPATNSTPDSHKHNLKDSMTSHQSPLVPLDHKKRSKSVSTLSDI